MIDPEKILEALEQALVPHMGHKWKQVGRCVYCDDCAARLYQGKLPPNRPPDLIIQPRPPAEPKATTEMRQRWGKA